MKNATRTLRAAVTSIGHPKRPWNWVECHAHGAPCSCTVARSRSLNSPYVAAERGNHRLVCSGARAVGRIQVEDTGSADLGRASPTTGIRAGGAPNPVSSTQGGLVKRKRIVVAVICGVGLAAPAAASAARSGGAYASEPATITAVSCVTGCATTDCRAGRQPAAHSRTRDARGREDRVPRRQGQRRQRQAPVLRARHKSVDVVVPEDAPSGRLRAVNTDGARSPASQAIVSVQRGAGSAALDVQVVGRRVFYDAARPARVDLLAREPMAVTVVLVRVADGAIVQGWPVTLAPGVVASVQWDGRIAGVAQPPGRYEFRVSPARARRRGRRRRRAGRAGDRPLRPRRPQVPRARTPHLRRGPGRVRRRPRRPRARGPRRLRPLRHAARRRPRRAS